MGKGWLNQENVFVALMYKLSNLFLLNLLWIIFSIPVITAGAATAAMYTVTFKMVRNEESYIAHSFWVAFRKNFKQGMVLGLLIIFLGAFLYVDLYIVAVSPIAGKTVYQFLFMLIGIFGTMTASYLFPVLAQYDAALGKIIKIAAYMSFRHVLFTLLIVVITVFPVVLVAVIPYLLPFLFIIGISGGAMLNSYLFERIFLKYIK